MEDIQWPLATDQESVDVVDGFFTSCFRRKQDIDEDENTELENTRTDGNIILSKSKKYDAFYSMDFESNGYLLIIANSRFTYGHIQKRDGADEDIRSLKSSFDRLNFKTRVCKDYKLREIRNVIREVSSMNFENYASVVIAVSSHGGCYDEIAAMDAPYYPETDLFEPFKHNESLMGKPKIFLLGCCRGESVDDGIDLTATVETDGSQLDEFKVPTEADVLVVYATVKDYLSYHNQKYGSQFFIFLTEALDDLAAKWDLLIVLTLANQRLSIDFQSYNPLKPEYHDKKQCMCILNTLTRIIKFRVT